MSERQSDLVSRLTASGLVNPEQLSKCRAALGETANDRQLLQRLVKIELLTEWQATQLQAGKERGFFLEHYKLLEPLGAGGMGQVFRAMDTELNRLVAVKVLPKRLATPEAVQRFRREGQASLELQHEHIVRSFELGQQGSAHFLVMELVEGTDLAAYITKHGKLSVQQTARIGYEVALALEQARRHGIIHRDIKPSNILLTRGGRAKLADLGLARFFGARRDVPSALTHTGAFMGTVDYVAPEQAEDAKRADTRSDIYSLGCTLYQCLTGQPPFPNGTSVQKIVAHRELDPEPITRLNAGVPLLLAELIAKRMLAKRPEDRYQLPAEVAGALKPWASGESESTDLARLAALIGEEEAAEAATAAAAETDGHKVLPRHIHTVPSGRIATWEKPRRYRRRWPATVIPFAGLVVIGIVVAWMLGPWRAADVASFLAESLGRGFGGENSSPHIDGTASDESGYSRGVRSAEQPLSSDEEFGQILADLRSHDAAVRARAVLRLVATQPSDRRDEVVQALKPLTADSDVLTRRSCAEALGAWGDEQTVQTLIDMLRDESPLVRWAAIESLGKLQDERGAEAVIEFLADPPAQAAKALVAMGSAAETPVAKCLQHEDGNVRIEACKILKEIGTKKSLPALQAAARDKKRHPRIAKAAQDAISSVSARK
jgi:serine/threonine-protein kinase